MHWHASCAAWPRPDAADRDGPDAVLLLGAPGAGKSDFLLCLVDAGWQLVADDQVTVTDGVARAPAALAGLIEIRGLGIFRLPYVAQARLRLVVELGVQIERLPAPRQYQALGLPLVTIDPAQPSAVARCKIALDAACGRAENIAGAFAP
jgi:HPr kinase/phosphorylase